MDSVYVMTPLLLVSVPTLILVLLVSLSSAVLVGVVLAGGMGWPSWVRSLVGVVKVTPVALSFWKLPW